MKSILVALSVLVALCHSHTIPWVKKQPAMVRNNVQTIPWFTKRPAMVRTNKPQSTPWLTKQPAIVVSDEADDDDVQCPDKVSSCPADTSCCALLDGFYGCCPAGADAVCCDDEKHCCPNGYKCNPATYECFKEDWSFEAMVQFPSKKSKYVKCPGGKAQCPMGNTCCMMENNQYGCCPTPNAACCSDNKHCCASGYECNKQSKKCVKTGIVRLMAHKLEDARPVLKTKAGIGMCPNKLEDAYLRFEDIVGVGVVCPHGWSQCPANSTCCPLGRGRWGCCRLPDASCCPDKIHCCGHGYTCNTTTSRCDPPTKSRDSNTLKLKVITPVDVTANVVCPDGQSQCPEGTTCCKLSSGQYGCCPIPDAVCCSDGIHCCPSGYTCDVSQGTCNKAVDQVTSMALTAVVTNVICPDGQSECPDGNTCCKLTSGQWGCCPLPSAVCCSDGEHCCPQGYTCDVSAGTCSKSDSQVALIAVKDVVTNVICPDGQSECPDGNTCCKLSSGQWGCCPLPSAVCCSDGVHCCPQGYTCDVSAGTCSKSDSQVALIAVEDVVTNVICPDGQSECPDGNTCCKLSSGQWGCCPLPSAVCCSDGEHCCPQGYTCDVSAGTCIQSDSQVALIAVKDVVTNVICPDGQSECPDGNTCCKLTSGQWGCCPLPNAVCCSDGVHCCPQGYTCDVSAGTCSKSDSQVALIAVEDVVTNVICPDGQSECPDGNTCCKLSSGQWGCCPLPSAVCCSDGEHCCPQGYTCDVSAGTCIQSDSQVALIAVKDVVTNVICPDGQSECPDGNTCCKLSSGEWGCCPLPSAVCCSDGLHCCPQGYTCDTAGGTCIKSSDESPRTDLVSLAVPDMAANVICPDGQSQCPDGSTCCILSSGQWGCCPFPDAVCCSDGEHCCPDGYKCDAGSGSCFMSDGSKFLAFGVVIEATVSNVICPDGQSQCPDGNTCCKLSSGQWGCCPLPNAVCCSDGEHCCPQGYTCDVSAGTCSKSDSQVALIAVEDVVTNVICPDGQSECPDGNTCCKLTSGQWGCCPLPSAVCCSDGEHCCPQGYACDVSAGTCSKSDSQVALIAVEDVVTNVICPDGQSECPDGNTCCKLTSGQWGCCPLPSAVCCSDGEHCCPQGYTCDVSAGTCSKSDGQVALVAIADVTANVVCPDGQSQCPEGNTCCKLSSGQYGCCPLPDAVCCSDGLHCCPQGHTCDTAGGTCIKSSDESPRRDLVSLDAPVDAVICPDGESQCPNDYTCCKMSTGQWGCCPLPKAVCCDDGLHCCPNGYTCNTGGGTCQKSNQLTALISTTEINDQIETNGIICPDGQSQCPDTNTCCKLSSGEWGCCPLPNAVCCSDGQHCCPQGYTCDVSAGTCSKSDSQVALIAVEDVVTNVICPDGQSQCPDGNTCCKLSSGQWGCCPLPNAVCCSDGLHCCPQGYTCDVSAGTCSKSDSQVALIAVEDVVTNVICPDGQSQCPDGNTCCKLTSGQWGCCPLPSAVCCSDGLHCCPQGYTCDVSTGTCSKSDDEVALVAIADVTANLVCPDGQTECQDGNTCCKLNSGEWGCCPLPDAVCCSDGEHCCPQGYTCDVSTGACIQSDSQVALIAVKDVVTNVICPDGQSECPDGNTCCKLTSGQWGCCPLPNAVCCSDGLHCCPQGYTCDVSAGTCSKSDSQVALIAVEDVVTNVICPDGQSQCPDGNTCCKLTSGQWGCCPLPSAVCCSDGLHCCPQGYTCDVSTGTCSKSDDEVALVAIADVTANLVCPDGQTECQDGNTCCKLNSGEWGCCPLPDAVCCSDGEHCCPQGYTCDVSTGACIQSDSQVALIAVKDVVTNVICPDGQSECPDGNTCCKLTSGQWGCCPLPSAVCCSDGVHCCPQGYTCDVSAGTCSKSDSQVSLIAVEDVVTNVICPDGQSQCPDGNTCCKLTSGQWGCCPLPNAVCCSDGLHCCPQGYTCDVSTGTCSKSDDEVALVAIADVTANLVCPDGQTECQDGNTCCKLSSGEWGCCPLPDAVCCSDGEHCCPQGYTCDVSTGACIQSDSQVALIAVKDVVTNVICPDGQSECPDGNTCCKLTSGQWGCCPLPSAVCCSDGVHCCPQGYTCDVSAGTCSKSDSQVSLIAVEDVVTNVICPDGQSQCPDGNTCCKLTSGQWGCCPLPNAVCCSDGLHCCPQGYTCDVSTGTCSKSDDKVALVAIADVTANLVCPDGQTECQDGNTCCKLSSGEWGCCPLPDAVCCSDGEHCCPQGYTCDVSTGACIQSDRQVALIAVKDVVTNVICPDGQSECPDGNTCCKLTSGQWGCCPLPSAVCCSDGVHCCPQGYTCDVSAGTCSKSDSQVALIAVEDVVTNVICPDGQSECPDGNTCCKLTSGQWGCCPLPNAVCCSDGVHCCPQGYICDVSTGTCSKSDGQVALVAIADVTANLVCPDGQTVCQDGSTCCRLVGGDWGCCPYPNAVCCSDGEHCCPSGYKCDVSAGTCTISDVSQTLLVSRHGVGDGDSSIICPDGKSICRDGDTCCESAEELWACCPLPKAVCCADKTHCCPEGHTCDATGKYCSKSSSLVSMVTSLVPNDVVCPDGQSYCPDGNTCCKLSSGQWGCCPIPNAVCCSDGQHCCPQGYTCDVSAGTCIKSDSQVVLTAVKDMVTNVICPDGQSQCPDGNTCCKLTSGQWGCCPLPSAVCCSDGEHCCPQGYTCDVSAGTCSKSDSQVALIAVEDVVTNVICPDGQSECPDGNTCCKLTSGQWGCCPLPSAVCCSDGEHCCPQGYTCDVSAGTCSKSDSQVALIAVEDVVTNVICPDGQSECPDGNTCCKLTSGQWGCCPLPNAVCCSDGEHCCPQGYTCDVSAGTCSKSDSQVALIAVEDVVTNVICPDGQSECPDGNTCCKLTSGQWGCCPLPSAVCCSDGVHCCPQGYTCDVSAGTCSKSDSQLALIAVEDVVTNVICPDGQSECPDGNTCCKLTSGQWGCCPLPSAVCCSDGVHCCPQGYTCDASAGTCSKSDSQVALVAIADVTANVVCPDGQSQCPDGNTCCKLSSGQWGCCPLPNAVCCSDGLHCCPQGYTCDVSTGTCSKSGDQVIMVAVKEVVNNLVCPDGTVCQETDTCCNIDDTTYGCCPLPNAVCCDDGIHCCAEGYTCDTSTGTCLKAGSQLDLVSLSVAIGLNIPCSGGTQCADGTTCCEMTTGEYGCCPLPEAVCCSDKLHCCPQGYQCEVSTGSCIRSADNALTTVSLVKEGSAARARDVVCPGGQYKCPESNTCCKLPDGKYGCCPLPNAVCCSDGLHCCPQGNKCDVQSAKCESGQDVIPSLLKIPAIPGKYHRSVIKCC